MLSTWFAPEGRPPFSPGKQETQPKHSPFGTKRGSWLLPLLLLLACAGPTAAQSAQISPDLSAAALGNATAGLTPNAVKAILMASASPLNVGLSPALSRLTQGAGCLNVPWGNVVTWGNSLMTGNVLGVNQAGWGVNVVWGDATFQWDLSILINGD